MNPATIGTGPQACTSKKRRNSGGVHAFGSGRNRQPWRGSRNACGLKRLPMPSRSGASVLRPAAKPAGKSGQMGNALDRRLSI
jgi:hypothetical protein